MEPEATQFLLAPIVSVPSQAGNLRLLLSLALMWAIVVGLAVVLLLGLALLALL